MPKTGKSADVTWFEVDTCYVFHVMNAHEQGDRVMLDVARYDALWVEGSEDFDRPAYLTRFVLDLSSGEARTERLDDRVIEFPQIDQRLAGRPYRYGYALHVTAPPAAGARSEINGLLKVDHERGTRELHVFDGGQSPGEVIFVPAAPDSGEDEGYLLTYLYDPSRDRSDLLVLDASQVGRPPIARVKLPVRVPVGFHGHWVRLG